MKKKQQKKTKASHVIQAFLNVWSEFRDKILPGGRKICLKIIKILSNKTKIPFLTKKIYGVSAPTSGKKLILMKF